MKNQFSKSSERAIIFLAWGEPFVDEVFQCVSNSVLPEYDIVLITDKETKIPDSDIKVIRVDFKLSGLMRKVELYEHIPKGYKSYLFLDSDVIVVDDIVNGFEKAELHGMALSPAPHYSLDHFWGFDKVLHKEGVKPAGQLQYNTGVIFFSLNKETTNVLTLWRELGERHPDELQNDQPYLSLAFEMKKFNPYTLSIGYNYRGFGCAISGVVRVWHSHTKMPDDINDIETVWPPRRVIDGEVHQMMLEKRKSRIAEFFKLFAR